MTSYDFSSLNLVFKSSSPIQRWGPYRVISDRVVSMFPEKARLVSVCEEDISVQVYRERKS